MPSPSGLKSRGGVDFTQSTVRPGRLLHASERANNLADGVKETELGPQMRLQVQVGGYHVEIGAQGGESAGRHDEAVTRRFQC